MLRTVLVVPRCHVRRALAALFAVLAPIAVLAQATSDANQVFGDVELVATDPAVVAVLAAEGISSGTVSAQSVGVTPTLTHSTAVTVAAPALASYELTVEAGPPGDGIVYDLDATLRLDGGRDLYRFEGVTSGAVEREPAVDVEADFGECVALLELRWETPSGAPVSVSGGRINALLHTPTGGRFLQAWTPSLGAVAAERLLVRGGHTFDVEVFFDFGGDPFTNQVRLLHEAEVTAACDQVIEIVCEVPAAGGGGEGEGLGRIVGEIDMLGSFEERVGDLTLVRAEDGPFGNLRLDTVEPLTPGGPSSGGFELVNVPSSNLTSPPTGYRVFADMTFDTPGGHHQWFRTPSLDGGNGRVLAADGQTVDLGDTFVMDPGLLVGDLRFVGPPAAAGGNCLADLAIVDDGGGDGLPDGSALFGFGSATAAQGATLTTFRGELRSALLGAFDPVDDEFTGAYEAVVGALDGEAGRWRAHQLVLRFNGFTVPDGLQDSQLNAFDLLVPEVTVAPGDEVRFDRRLCFGELHVGFRSLGGNAFLLPRLAGTAVVAGTDAFGDTVDQVHSVFGFGTPRSFADASTRGLVNLCLPEGSYDFTPTVLSVDPDGTTSNTQLPPIEVAVACGQVLDLVPGLQVSLDAPPACVAEPSVRLAGGVASDGDPVDHVFGTANGGSETTFCTACGADPAFSFDQPLDACDNQVTVAAEAFGETAAATAATRFDGTPPAFAGCEDVTLDSPAATVVDFAVTATDGCDGALPVTCDPPSGSLFAPGDTEVTCRAADACGNQAVCAFTVSTCTATDPDVRTQGFWKRQCAGPHPAGEHERLAEYAELFAAGETFAGVDGVEAMCDRLEPQPKRDKCEQAEAQLAALLLNVASDRIRTCNCIADPDLGRVRLADALATLDALLSDPARSHADCVLAQAVADRVNRGDSTVDCDG